MPERATIADIFRQGFDDYCLRERYVPPDHRKAAKAIMECRTVHRGGHRYQCDQCRHERIAYNSCRNRHCPQCQAFSRAEWVQKQMGNLLPVPYFHAVFTLPSELNPFALRNKAPFYALLFRAVSETLLELAKDKKRLGAALGFIAVLHTWGQNLSDHPHLHCVIPGGGLRAGAWAPCRRKFLFPIRVMGALFKGKCLDYFKRAVAQGDILFHGSLAAFHDPAVFQALMDQLYAKDWIVYLKSPFAGPQAVLKYLGRYTHRIALSNHRILSVQNGQVSFLWKDYRQGNTVKVMTLSTVEFIRRFLLHVLPKGFVRIRHYGLLCNRTRKKNLQRSRIALGVPEPPEKEEKTVSWIIRYQRLTGKDPTLCPVCGKGHLILLGEIGASPPERAFGFVA